MVENCAESATTVKPHTSPTTSSTHVGAPDKSPINTAQIPEIAIIKLVVFVLPHRSPSTPPAQQPSAPIPITANVAYAAPAVTNPCGFNAFAKNTKNQA